MSEGRSTMATKYRDASVQKSYFIHSAETLGTRVASLPFPLIVLIVLLMGIAKYFG